ncbi:hypothetical protein Tco_0259038, partial [Tanacetum coccineum]
LGEEVWIFLPELIFTFLCKLRASPRVPSKLDNWDSASPQLFDFAIHDFYRLFNKMKLVIHLDHQNNISSSWIHETYCGPCSALEEAQACKQRF